MLNGTSNEAILFPYDGFPIGLYFGLVKTASNLGNEVIKNFTLQKYSSQCYLNINYS